MLLIGLIFVELLFYSSLMRPISKTLLLSPDHYFFIGHFPNFPVLPAVGFIKISHQIIESEHGATLILNKAEGWKFRQALIPNKELLFEANPLTSELSTNLPPKWLFHARWSYIGDENPKITEGILEFLDQAQPENLK